MRKLFSMVFAIALVLSLMSVSAVAEGAGSIQLSPSVSEAHPGDTFTVTVTVTSNPGTAYINFTPSYDTGKLELTNKTVGSGWTAGATSISWDSATVETVTGYAATLTFKVKEGSSSGSISVSGSVEAVAFEGDSDEFSVPFSVSGCSVSVQPAPHDHNWGSGVVTKEASCTEKGVRTYTCSICNQTKTEDIPMTDHVTELRNKKDASCKEEGYTGDEVCKNCNQVIKAGETIAKTEHSWNAGVVTKEANCKEKGVRTYTCTVCNETKTEDIPMTDHVTELRNKKDASCKEEGYTGDEVCKNCNQVITAGQTIAKTEHSWNAGVVTKEASCTEKGVRTYTCTVCNETKTEDIPMTAHVTELRNKKDASCKEEGYTGDEVCKNCNQVITAGQTIAKTEHSWNAGVVTKEANCKEKGVKTYTCTVCNETKTEDIPMTDHVTELRNKKDANCKEEGYTGDEVCKNCNQVIKAGEKIAKTEHSWNAGVVTKEANCKEKGSKTVTCTVCNETQTVEIPMTAHETELRNKKDASCKEEGYTGDEVCKNCNQVIKAGEKIAKTDHSWNEGTVTKEASCKEKGSKTVTCTVCNETKTEEIPMLPHSWGPWEITVKAEDGKEGTRTHTCTECSTVASEAFTITTLEGAGGKYIKGSGKTLSFRFSEELALFEDIYVDGNKVDARNYSKASGSTVITLHNMYLSQLAAGNHTIRAVFSSGNVSTNFSCVSPSNTPSTGDNSNIGFWLGLLAVAAVGVGAVSVVARKKARAK